MGDVKIKKMTFEKYDSICEILERLPLCDYYPTKEDIEEMESKFDEFLIFLIYISEFHTTPETKEDKETLTLVKDVINYYLELE